MRDYNLITLDNGIRVVHHQVKSTKIVHCGFTLDIGSRDEKNHQQGLAHFWEHMAFKGTEKRRGFQIINRLESVGGELNAFTTKEKICFFASVLDNHLNRSVELLTDITFNSTFPERQIDLERNVILEEMSMYRDNPEDAIQDDLDALVFGKHSMGVNILGTEKSVKGFKQASFKEFVSSNLDTSKVVFSIVGNISEKRVAQVVKKHLEPIERKVGSTKRMLVNAPKPIVQKIPKPISQAHCAIGGHAYSVFSKKRIPLALMVNILGGPGMNSRLNMALREKRGYVYSIDANYTSYTDTGIFSLFFATENNQMAKSVKIVEKEIVRLKEQTLGNMQLHKAKQQIMGQLAMGEENNSSLMLMMGKSLLDRGEIPSLDDLFAQIENVSSKDILDVANEILIAENLSHLYYLPE